MRVLASHAQPSALSSTLLPAADARTGTAYAAPRDRRVLLSGILESLGDFLGFRNNQAHPSDLKDPGSGATSTPSSPEPTTVQPPVDQPSPPAPAPPASYPAPGGGGQVGKPTSSASTRLSVSPEPLSSSAGSAAGPAPHSTSLPAAMTVVPALPTAHPMHDPSDVPTDHAGQTAASPTVSPGWPSISPPVNGAPSPTQSPSPGAQIGRAKQFPLAASAAIGAVLGFLVVSALFWAVWLALRRRRRAYPEFASVHPKCVSVPDAESVSADGNPFSHPRDEKEDDPFDAALWRASSARSMASTMSV